MFTNWAESAKSSVTQAFEKTGDAISKAATQAGRNARAAKHDGEHLHSDASPPLDDTTGATVRGRYATAPQQQQQQPEFLTHLSQGWSQVVQSTQASMQQAEAKMKEQQTKIQNQISRAKVAYYYRRDPSLPLDVEALRDAHVVYVTDRIVTMGHPAMPSQTNGDISGERKLAAVGHLLQRRHAGHYMVWNLSEVPYENNSQVLDDQVLTYSFPGSPSPPLGLWLKLLVAMESWLKADPRNIAVVHCLTGKGRTSLVVAALLCWMGEAGFNNDMTAALQYIARCKQVDPDALTIPSQRRYALYFTNLLDSVRPSQPPVRLQRILFSQAPQFCKKTDGTAGCVPYIQLFKAGQLLHTVAATTQASSTTQSEIPFCHGTSNIRFDVDCVVQGDVLVRARHLTASRQRVSMFRIAFHTGYAPPHVMRLTRPQLDGACDDAARFPADFFVDMIFAPIDGEESSEPAASSTTAEQKPSDAAAVRASPDDTMLHRDSRFWNVIATRVKEKASTNNEDADEEDEWVGPTVGRRRNFDAKKAGGSTPKDDDDDDQNGEGVAASTFSIGGEFAFLPTDDETNNEKETTAITPQQPNQPKDSLMEALMGAIDDSGGTDDDDGDEVIVFADSSDGGESLKTASDAGSAVVVPHNDTAAATTTSSTLDAALANLQLDDNEDDEDMDALLAGGGMGSDDDDDLLNLDVDDPDLDDLESFLSK